ncbi:MAG: CvpA family protein [Chloroflexia bacterium]
MSFTWPDWLAIITIVWFALFSIRRGFVAVTLSLVALIAGFALSFIFYPTLAALLTERLGWSPVWSRPVAFVAVWVVVETVFSALARVLTGRLDTGTGLFRANRAFAVFPGAAQGLLVAAVLLTLLAVAPTRTDMGSDIVNSPVGGTLVRAAMALERPLDGVFGPGAKESFGFITVKPPQQGEAPEEGIKLDFTVYDPSADQSAEEGMLALVNRERTSRGLQPLVMDGELRVVARAHAADMFKRGYFSHVTPEGKDPFDRMRDANILFGHAGENLALAPTLEMAHDGLMNSPGHRANILNAGFRKVGIGVLDGGIYGKMFVQEFMD